MAAVTRIDSFEQWCYRRLLRVPWTARRSNQSMLKKISPEYSFGRTDAEAEAPILWPPYMQSQLIGKDQFSFQSRKKAMPNIVEITI